MELKIPSWNLYESGIDNGRTDRFEAQLDVMTREAPDVVGLQEATWGSQRAELLHRAAGALGMTFRVVVPSNHHNCDVAISSPRISLRPRTVDGCARPKPSASTRAGGRSSLGI